MRVKNNNLVENFIECMYFAKYFEKSRIDVYESTLKKNGDLSIVKKYDCND